MGITRQELLILVIATSPGKTATELARFVGGHPADISSLLNKMHSKKLIRRIGFHGPRGGYGYYPKLKEKS